MNKLAKKRYKNALKKAAKINRFIKKGYHVFHEGSPNKLGFVLENGWLLLRLNDRASIIYFKNDPDWDHGYWTPVAMWNKEFNESFEVFRPDAKVKL